MSMSLGSVDAATRFDDIIRRKVIQVLDQERPRPQYGTVTQIDRDLGTCLVQYADGAIVTVRMGEFQPSGVGQVVRVSDYAGKLWVTGIQGNTVLTGETTTNIGTPASFTMAGLGSGVVASWPAVATADQYEMVIAEDAGFTVNVRSFSTIDTGHTVPDLNVGTLYFGQVRGVSSHGSVGAFSPTDTATPPGFPAGGLDGSPPANSPAAIVDPGIGDLQVSWVPTTNQDTVTYEVHVSTTSGFTPGPTTLAGETTGSFFGIARMPDNSPLSYAANTFIRIIAKDGDGAAAPGVQGFGIPAQVQDADFDVLFSQIGDGIVPPDAAGVTASGGLGYVFATWPEVANDDLVKYEVHVGTTAGFLPTANSLVEYTRGTFAIIRNEPPGMGGGPVQYTTTYHVKILATDVDGAAANASPSATANPLQAGSGDIADDAVDTQHVAALAIGTAEMADASITTAKIIDLSVERAKIALLAVDSAQIANAAITNAKIANLAVTNANIANATITAAKINDLNADAIIAGTINAIDITASDITGGTMTGSVIQSSTVGNARVGVYSAATAGVIDFTTADVDEDEAAFITTDVSTTIFGDKAGELIIKGLDFNLANGPPVIDMHHRASNGDAFIRLQADIVRTQAPKMELNSDDGSHLIEIQPNHPFIDATATIETYWDTPLTAAVTKISGPSANGAGTLPTASISLIQQNNGQERVDLHGNLQITNDLDPAVGQINTTNTHLVQSVGGARRFTQNATEHIVWANDTILRRAWHNDLIAQHYYANRSRYWELNPSGDMEIHDGVGFVLWATTGTIISDRNMKKNIEMSDVSKAAEAVEQIEFVEFEYKDESVAPGKRYGVIAQDVEKVWPQGVRFIEADIDGDDTPNGNYLLDEPGMISLLLGAVKHLQSEVADLKVGGRGKK